MSTSGLIEKEREWTDRGECRAGRGSTGPKKGWYHGPVWDSRYQIPLKGEREGKEKGRMNAQPQFEIDKWRIWQPMITPRMNRLETNIKRREDFFLLARLVWRIPPKGKKTTGMRCMQYKGSLNTSADWPKHRKQAKYRKIPERPSKTRDAGEADAKFFRVWEKQIRRRYGVTSSYKGLRIGQTEQSRGNFTAKIKRRSARVVGLNVAVLGLSSNQLTVSVPKPCLVQAWKEKNFFSCINQQDLECWQFELRMIGSEKEIMGKKMCTEYSLQSFILRRILFYFILFLCFYFLFR